MILRPPEHDPGPKSETEEHQTIGDVTPRTPRRRRRYTMTYGLMEGKTPVSGVTTSVVSTSPVPR